jgi:hypothetical protein
MGGKDNAPNKRVRGISPNNTLLYDGGLQHTDLLTGRLHSKN